MLTRTKNQADAASMAKDRGMLYGLCIFDGWFYVGAVEQLEELGCIIDNDGCATATVSVPHVMAKFDQVIDQLAEIHTDGADYR